MMCVFVVLMEARSVSLVLAVRNTARLRNQGFLDMIVVEVVRGTRKWILLRYRMLLFVCALEVLVARRVLLVSKEGSVPIETCYCKNSLL